MPKWGLANPRNYVPLVAIVAITAIETVALLRGLDGMALSLSIGAISAVAGYRYAFL